MSALPWLYGAHTCAPQSSSVLSSAGRCLPLFFCNQKKSRKTVKEKFRPLPSRSRVRLPPKGGINAPPETVWFLISTASPTGSRAVFQYPSDARPPEVLRTSRGYYFDSAAQGTHFARRLSRGWFGARRLPPQSTDFPRRKKCSNRFSVNAVTGRGYNPSVKPLKAERLDSSPSIRSEVPSFIVARAAKPLAFGAKHQTQNVVRQSRTNILPKIHRGAENRAQLPQ